MKRESFVTPSILSALLLVSLMACNTSRSEQPETRNVDSVATTLNDTAMKRYQDYMVGRVTDPGELETSLQELDEAIKIQPEETLFHTNKANVLLTLKRDSEALNVLKNLVQIEPNFAEAFTTIGFIHERRARDDEARRWYDRAMSAYDRQITENRNVITSKIGQAFLLFFTEGRDAAMGAYTQLKQKYPNSKEVQFTEQTFRNFNRDQFLQDFHL